MTNRALPTDSAIIKQTDTNKLLAELGFTETYINSLTTLGVKGHKLREYQLRYIYACLKYRRYIVQASMGLGKTVTAAVVSAQLHVWRIAKKRTLFLVKSANGVVSVIQDIHNTTKQKAVRFATDPTVDYGSADIVVGTYAGLVYSCTNQKRVKGESRKPYRGGVGREPYKMRSGVDFSVIDKLKTVFDIFVLDEVQSAKNPESLTARVLWNLVSPTNNPTAAGVFGMTGTPTSRQIQDVWMQYRLIDGGRTLPESYDQFVASYCIPSLFRRPGVAMAYETNPYALPKLLNRLRFGSMVYHTDEVTDLPSFMYYIHPYTLTGASKDLYIDTLGKASMHEDTAPKYRAMLSQIVSGFVYIRSDLSMDTEHRSVTLLEEQPKARELVSAVEEVLFDDPSRVVLVFYYLTGSYSVLEQNLKKAKVECIHINPGISPRNLLAILDRINKSAGSVVVLANIASSSTSLNLQRADTVMFYDVPMVLIDYQQALYRIRRIGSKASLLHVHFFAGRHTIEMKRLKSLATGRGVAESFFSLDNLSGREGGITLEVTPQDFLTRVDNVPALENLPCETKPISVALRNTRAVKHMDQGPVCNSPRMGKLPSQSQPSDSRQKLLAHLRRLKGI